MIELDGQRIKTRIEALVGTPYAEDERDCYWFVRTIFAEAGIDIAQNFHTAVKDFEIIANRQFLDVVYTHPSRAQRGLAIVYSRTDVALCAKATNGVAIVPFNWLRDIRGIFRHKQLCA